MDPRRHCARSSLSVRHVKLNDKATELAAAATDTRHSANAIDSRIVILLSSPLNGLDKGT
jgi:hypothetical protein